MTDVRQWLTSLGFDRYVETFAANAIGIDVLADLSDTDLEKLGIPLGDRKRLLKAIAARGKDDQASTEALSPGVTCASEAERRQLTVMFCDLVGSTALSARLDPEDLREIIGTYHRCVADTVRGFDGFVAKYMGDGVLVYFGYPQAHEDDAERAVRAGLALVDAVGRLSNAAPESLEVRIGISTGPVIVGDLIGRGEAQERGVVGETPNLAARLQAIAGPNTVVIAASTRRLVGNLFECRDLGAVAAKGFAEPVSAWCVLRESGFESRFEAFHASALTPIVGREEEIDLLLRRWERAKKGEGQMVLLSGEPGIGKSRVIVAALEQFASDPHIRLRYFCSPNHTDSALYPVIRQLERAAGFEREDDPQAKRRKLDALLSVESTPAADRRLIGELLSVADSSHSSAQDVSSLQRKQMTLEALLRQIDGRVRHRPVLIIFEDVHWIDPTTLELLDRMVERIRQLRVLLLVTFRPEFAPSWIGQPQVTLVTLSRLDQRERAALVEQIVGDAALTSAVVAEIVDRTDGVPLYVEELTKAVLEAGAGQSNAPGTLSFPAQLVVAIPATLHALLMARLDRLGPTAKEVSQIGATIGREFSYELLAAVGQHTDAELRDGLGRLVEAGLAFCRGQPPHATYLFKHALVQDASYETLLRNRRQQLHARVATVLEERFPEIVEQRPEQLAHHCGKAGLVEKAIAYWGRAGRRSLAHGASLEAVAQLRKGLQLLASLPDSQESWRQELELQSALGAALVASKGNATLEAGQAYSRARELCEALGDTTALVPVLSGLSTYHQQRGEFSAMRQIAEELLRLGEVQNDTASSLVGNRSMGLCLYHLGEFRSAQTYFERVLSLYAPEAHHALASVAAFDMRAVAQSYLSLIHFILGYPMLARSWCGQALSWSRNMRHPHNLAFSLNYAAMFNLLQRDEPAAEEMLDELISLAAEYRFPVWLASANLMRGYVLAGRSKAAEALELARDGLASRAAIGSKWHETYYLGLLAQGCEREGQIDAAFDLLAAALEISDHIGERWYDAELHRHKGEWLMTHGRGEDAEAEASFRCALALAQQQKARIWELRASVSRARLWRDRGRHHEARDLLEPVYSWFTEGFDIPDLQEAKLLLDELV